jgi:hypothetical protein
VKTVAFLLTAFLVLVAACDEEETPSQTTTPTITSTGLPKATATAPPGPTSAPTIAPTVPGVPGPTSIAALNGLRCVGQWRNLTFGSTGAFAARVEAGGAGGALTLELGGNVFGGQGGVTELPFRQVGNELEIEAHTQSMGHVSARIGLDGKATGSLQGVPALGPRSEVTLTEYSFASNSLRMALRINFGDGRPAAQSVVEAACTR